MDEADSADGPVEIECGLELRPSLHRPACFAQCLSGTEPGQGGRPGRSHGVEGFGSSHEVLVSQGPGGSICSAWEVKLTRSAKKHGPDLALLMGRRRSLHQCSTALGAEFRPRLIPVAARAANAHRKSLRLPADDVIAR